MRQSVAEVRTDGKASPLVGAVLWGPDGNVETAYRGELRDGDHAEYTLLERKRRASRLDGTVLFSTLEPCAPGARRHPKLSCAERIVNARIKEVWVGIEDPDPTVDRRGIRFLQDHGVAVHLFDPDLQRQIREANQAFLDQALERAAVEEEPQERPLLSPLEDPLPTVEIRDLDADALNRYREEIGTTEALHSPAFIRRLLQLGLVRESDTDGVVATGYGLLLFGREPRAALPQVGLLATAHLDDGREEVRDFDGPQVFAPDAALDWLGNRLPNPIDRSAARRREGSRDLLKMAREALVNAIIHRDYAIKGAKCQLVVTEEAIKVMSPGAPVPPITLEQMQSFAAPMLSRNPVLHYVFSRMRLAEERGLGLKSLRQAAKAGGLPAPRFTWQPPYMTLTLYRSAIGMASELAGPAAKERLTGPRGVVWNVVSTRDSITTGELMNETGFDERKVQRIVSDLRDAGLLRRTGNGRATRYEVPAG